MLYLVAFDSTQQNINEIALSNQVIISLLSYFYKLLDIVQLDKAAYCRSAYVHYLTTEYVISPLDGKTVVIAKDALESDMWQKKVIHEIEHFAEDTQEWIDYADFIFKNTDTAEAIDSVLKSGYGITQDDIDTLQSALESKTPTEKHKLILSEVTAAQSEILFGDEAMIEKLTKDKRHLAQKMYEKIKSFVQVLKAKTPEEKQLIKTLQTAQSLFEKALSKSGTKYAVDMAKKNTELDGQDEKQYSKKQDYKHITKEEYKKLSSLIMDNNAQSIANEIELQRYDTENTYDYFYIYENFGIGDFGVLKQIPNTDVTRAFIEEVRKKIGENKNGSIIRSTSELNRLLKVLKSKGKIDSGNNAINPNGKADISDGGTLIGESGGNGERNTEKSSGDKRTSLDNPLKDSENVRFSRKPFSEQVDDVIEGKHIPEYDLYVSETPKVLLDIGLPDKPLLMRNAKVMEILDKHSEMSVGLIKAIPETIKEPIIILKSKSNPNESVVLITQLKTNKGEMIVPVWINQDGTYLDVLFDKPVRENTNFVASAYGRNTKTLLEYALENNEVLYYNSDKEKVRQLLATHGLQLPARLSISNSNTSILNLEEKSTDNDKKIQYSLKDSENKHFYKFTKGQIEKLVANNTRLKVYTKEDSEKIINNVIGNYMAFGEKYGDMSGKTKKQVVDMLWKGLNSANVGYQGEVALDIADYIIQNAAMESVYADHANATYADVINALKPYLHSLDLSGIKGEIKARYDKDNSPYLRWGKNKNKTGVSVDVAAQELANNGFEIDAVNAADMFFEIDTVYDMQFKARQRVYLEQVNPNTRRLATIPKAILKIIFQCVLTSYFYP